MNVSDGLISVPKTRHVVTQWEGIHALVTLALRALPDNNVVILMNVVDTEKYVATMRIVKILSEVINVHANTGT